MKGILRHFSSYRDDVRWFFPAIFFCKKLLLVVKSMHKKPLLPGSQWTKNWLKSQVRIKSPRRCIHHQVVSAPMCVHHKFPCISSHCSRSYETSLKRWQGQNEDDSNVCVSIRLPEQVRQTHSKRVKEVACHIFHYNFACMPSILIL